MKSLSNRITTSGQVLPFTEEDYEKTYYQVVMGQYGVVLPKNLNLDAPDGLQLVQGKASMITDETLAEKIAETSGGKLIKVTERYTREIETVRRWFNG